MKNCRLPRGSTPPPWGAGGVQGPRLPSFWLESWMNAALPLLQSIQRLQPLAMAGECHLYAHDSPPVHSKERGNVATRPVHLSHHHQKDEHQHR